MDPSTNIPELKLPYENIQDPSGVDVQNDLCNACEIPIQSTCSWRRDLGGNIVISEVKSKDPHSDFIETQQKLIRDSHGMERINERLIGNESTCLQEPDANHVPVLESDLAEHNTSLHHFHHIEPCNSDCLCKLINPQDSLDQPESTSTLDVEEIYQVLGRDILKSSLLEDIDLYLECDDDNMYVLSNEVRNQQLETCHISEETLMVRVSFPDNEKRSDQIWFICAQCQSQFRKKTLLFNHRANIHGEKNLFVCSKCPYKGSLYSHFQKHVKRKHFAPNLQRRKLKSTGQSAVGDIVPVVTHNSVNAKNPFSSNSLENRQLHADLNQISCDDTSIVTTSVHFQHVSIKSDICNVKTNTLNGDITKIPTRLTPDDGVENCSEKSEKSQKERFQCKLCSFSCGSRKLLWSHCHYKHNPDRQVFQCEICAQVFKQKRSIETHLKKHHNERNHTCERCEKNFTSKSTLTAHEKSHLTCRDFPCGVSGCKAKFKTQSAQKGHMEVVHGEKTFVCPVDGCKKSYTVERHLRSHVVTHTQKFRCSWLKCGKTFRDRYNLDKHYQTHSGVKDMKCSLCNFACVQKASLNWHMKCAHS